MSYAPNPEGLRSAFAAERFTFEETTIQFSLAQAGRLGVSSGKIAAGDPQAEPAPQPFTQCVPNGEYPVTLAIARFENGDERIAYARAQLGDAAVANWYPALLATQDASTLKHGEIFGYSVESGSACFMDPQAGLESAIVFAASGGGPYASYFGYSADGRVVSLVSDFAVVPNLHDAPPAGRSWWKRLLFFWK
ncbi:DUF4241 domain-containing protein [Duganella sp. Root1480D1]|uniref:DUF4241 domain-containing protein n=1 Tax=Duganella sp. Root1480D1 TaxID=1736471 RepID=UPI00070BFBCF|nr:DUF4241 domain-containing protein [Duganella sp. Root1480D1]KQZ42568.1 hypothetical protein ASD58_24720 [Duganella sp. Root1480D1]